MNSFKLEWQTARQKYSFELGTRTCIMGILNTTPDSFSDGGRYLKFDAAVEHGLKLAADGADILDIGGESSRPFSDPVSVQEELDRVIPVIEKLSASIDIPISIDTVKSEVAKAAIEAGASIINDITALEKDELMASVAVEKGVLVILMHMKGSPATMQINPQYDDFLNEIIVYLKNRANFAVNTGILPEHIVLDPGIGFGKTVEHNLMVIKYIEKIAQLGFPILVGPSRKSFIQKILANTTSSDIKNSRIIALSGEDKLSGKISPPLSPKTETGTMAAVAASILNGAHIIRVHDVASARAVANIINAVQNVNM
ncbi:MAG: dihydropteroate synthase [Desulfamplus sp.]|nr:dihydropteroate synthase [Desulfamplus sp.]